MKKINILITGYNSLVGKAIIKTIYNSESKNLFNVYSSDYIKPKYYDLKVKDVVIFPDIFIKKSVKYKVIPIGIRTTTPVIKLFRNFEKKDFFTVLDII